MRSDALILTCIFISVFQRKRKDDEERCTDSDLCFYLCFSEEEER